MSNYVGGSIARSASKSCATCARNQNWQHSPSLDQQPESHEDCHHETCRPMWAMVTLLALCWANCRHLCLSACRQCEVLVGHDVKLMLNGRTHSPILAQIPHRSHCHCPKLVAKHAVAGCDVADCPDLGSWPHQFAVLSSRSKS